MVLIDTTLLGLVYPYELMKIHTQLQTCYHAHKYNLPPFSESLLTVLFRFNWCAGVELGDRYCECVKKETQEPRDHVQVKYLEADITMVMKL